MPLGSPDLADREGATVAVSSEVLTSWAMNSNWSLLSILVHKGLSGSPHSLRCDLTFDCFLLSTIQLNFLTVFDTHLAPVSYAEFLVLYHNFLCCGSGSIPCTSSSISERVVLLVNMLYPVVTEAVESLSALWHASAELILNSGRH
jgi:hypothetical protein